MSSKIIVISEIISNAGKKYVATNLAYNAVKKFKDKKVLLIDFDFENPVLAYNFVKEDNVHGIDNLVESINSDTLTDDLFKENIIRTPIGIDVLKGTRNSNNKKFFTAEHVNKVIELSRQNYEYIYIAVNPSADNAGTICSLLNADKLLIVAQNNYATSLKLDKVLSTLKQYYPQSNNISLVYNFKNLNASADFSSDLKKNDVSVVGVLEYDTKTIDNINLKNKVFFSKSVNFSTFEKINKLLLV